MLKTLQKARFLHAHHLVVPVNSWPISHVAVCQNGGKANGQASGSGSAFMLVRHHASGKFAFSAVRVHEHGHECGCV